MPKKEKYNYITDKKIMEYLNSCKKENGITMGEVCAKFKISQNAISPVKYGRQSFTMEHLHNILKADPNLNINWFFGLEINQYRKTAEVDPINELKKVVKMIEQKYR